MSDEENDSNGGNNNNDEIEVDNYDLIDDEDNIGENNDSDNDYHHFDDGNNNDGAMNMATNVDNNYTNDTCAFILPASKLPLNDSVNSSEANPVLSRQTRTRVKTRLFKRRVITHNKISSY